MQRPYTISDLTRRWRCSRGYVERMIEQGTLAAVVLPATESGRRKYLVQPEAVEAFERGLQVEEIKQRRDQQRRREAIRKRKRLPQREWV